MFKKFKKVIMNKWLPKFQTRRMSGKKITSIMHFGKDYNKRTLFQYWELKAVRFDVSMQSIPPRN